MSDFKHFWYTYFKPCLKRAGIIVIVSLILFSGWAGFIYLTGNPPLSDIWSSLIMVWLTVFMLIIAVFPQIFDKIKKLRIRDFEVILKRVLEDSTQKNLLSSSRYNLEQIELKEGNFIDLQKLIKKSIIKPEKSLILVINLNQKNSISIPLLFTYLFMLNFVKPSVIILFISSSTEYEIEEIRSGEITGTISGQDMLNTLYKLFPELLNLFNLFDKPGQINDVFYTGNFKDFSFEKFSDKAYEIFEKKIQAEILDLLYLNKQDINKWFGDDLNSGIINLPLNK
ncbi:MAG: hypothetical protein ACOCQS_02710, partial [Bacillota bacterium]